MNSNKTAIDCYNEALNILTIKSQELETAIEIIHTLREELKKTQKELEETKAELHAFKDYLSPLLLQNQGENIRLDLGNLNKSLIVHTSGGDTSFSAITVDVGTFGNDTNLRNSYFLKGRDVGSGRAAAFYIRGDGEIFGKIKYSQEFSWTQGQVPVKMYHSNECFCFITSVRGKFEGAGEVVHTYIGNDGFWYLGGSSAQSGVSACARCVGKV
ncbi:hypothetical protein NIES2100_49790 [Calothrix sp. NIES-2100]|uniref:hypothetical protein n=1 Tax=Calothrix sp. NIES-2100 TaxID=1954172 RepID=UPI000B6209C2|nr:hypothetical protein NIES2100_49790 [Calothrix sp. NIES-2100]